MALTSFMVPLRRFYTIFQGERATRIKVGVVIQAETKRIATCKSDEVCERDENQ